MKEIVVDISNDGQIQVETKGFTGKSCIEESQFIKDVLGSETARQLTPTFWQKGQAKIKKYLTLCG
jgi:hypothetical protein